MFKMRVLKHKVSTFFIVLVIILLTLPFFGGVSNEKLDLTTFDGIISAGKLYFSWLGTFAIKAKGITGNVINEFSDKPVGNSTK